MESIDFFQGTKIKPPLRIPFHDGKAELVCTISEGWGQIIVHSLKCGAKYVRKLKRSIGIVYTEKEDLESLVSGSLGLKGVASLDAQISSRTGTELQLSRSEEIEDEFTFEAPTCGEKVVALYQLWRIIDLKFRDDRLFHKKEWTMSTTYWTDRYHDNSHAIPKIPECGCEEDSYEPDEGMIYVDMGNITMTTGFIEYGTNLRIPALNLDFDKSNLHKPIQIETSKLPSHLLFLAGNIDGMIEAKLSFAPVKPDVISDNSQEYFLFDGFASLFSRQPEYAREKYNILRNALEEYLDFSRQSIRAEMLSSLFPYFTSSIKSKTLNALSLLTDQTTRARALSALAPHLNGEMKLEALAAAREIRDEFDRASVLIALAPHLSDDLKTKALQEALTAALSRLSDQPDQSSPAKTANEDVVVQLQSRTRQATTSEDEERARVIARLTEENPTTVAEIIQIWLNEGKKS